jgi:aerobic-type carbon monoxide dehydrogenase small subunit (CoxS/CutS family)
MTAAVDVMITVNGKAHAVRVAPFETLLTSLRDRLHLTAAKRGCNQGVCGACSVLIGGEPARACLSLTANCVDCEITTAEGLSTQLALSPLQTAMVHGGAIQCGFCTPGMLVTLTALLQECPRPSSEEIRSAVSSNICRCTGYQKIIEAVAALVEKGPP